MPQVDFENIVSACSGVCSDGKVACETLAEEDSTDDDATENDVITDATATNVDPDFPPESFWLSKDAEYDWFDRNAFYERKESGKGNSSSTNPNSNSNSQRFSVSLKSKAAIIGLPKTQKPNYMDSKRRSCKQANMRLFPKRPDTPGKSTLQPTVSMAEPGSPKVSCMGRVRSKRSRCRSISLKRKEKPVERSRSGASGEKKKIGFYYKVMSMFGAKKGRKKPLRSASRKVVEEEAVAVERRRESVSSEVREIVVASETAAEPPVLGGVKRFASGRRSGSWIAEDFHQTISVVGGFREARE